MLVSFGAGCDGSIPLHLQHKSWQAINPCQPSGTHPWQGQRFSPEAAKPKIMFFTGSILPAGTNKNPEQGGAGSAAPRAGTDPARPVQGRLEAQTFGRVDASSRIWSLTWLLRESSRKKD